MKSKFKLNTIHKFPYNVSLTLSLDEIQKEKYLFNHPKFINEFYKSNFDIYVSGKVLSKNLIITRPFLESDTIVVNHITIDDTLIVQELNEDVVITQFLIKYKSNYILTINFNFNSIIDYLIHKYYIFKFKIGLNG